MFYFEIKDANSGLHYIKSRHAIRSARYVEGVWPLLPRPVKVLPISMIKYYCMKKKGY